MSTKKHNSALGTALATVPANFRQRLITTYLDLKKNSVESRYDAAGLAAGKFCEIVLRFLQQKILGTFTPFGTKINNFADECQRLTSAPATQGNESDRVVIPRALVFLYTMRNKRGVGHVGGDVDANEIDTVTMARTADWILCELIRINHGLSLEEAQDIVDGISLRQLPTIWEIGGKRRVIKDGLKAREEALLLLYSTQNSSVLFEDLKDWVEYSNESRFRALLRGLHKERLIEFSEEDDSVVLSPKGAKYVEDNLL
ncbi:MAG: hypothetical protein ROO76_08595 [Terriglobia bacterium]|nr:hypothetical protein [Terriglobia bacterium]